MSDISEALGTGKFVTAVPVNDGVKLTAGGMDVPVGGGKDEYELKTYVVRRAISSDEVKATLDPSDATDAEVIAALKSVWRIVGNNQRPTYQPYFIADTNYQGSVMRWGAYHNGTLSYPIEFDTATNELYMATDEGWAATLSYLAPKA